jgi:hypothetical protein
MEGLEPPHLAASDPKSDVSTNFTTWAFKGCKSNGFAGKRKDDRERFCNSFTYINLPSYRSEIGGHFFVNSFR